VKILLAIYGGKRYTASCRDEEKLKEDPIVSTVINPEDQL